MTMKLGSLVLGTVASTALSCAGYRGGAIYDGVSRTAMVSPTEVRDLEELPSGYERLGDVRAHCTRYEGSLPPDGAPLSDVDCDEARLVAALRERAAEAGGELLIGRRCGSRVLHRDDATTRYGVTCSAEVARPGAKLLAARPLGPPAGEVSAPPAREAWRVHVRFARNPGVARRAPRAPDRVREVALVPVSHVRLGDVVTECDDGCSEAATRQGVLVAAARLGATDVADVRCARLGEGFSCQGTAAAYEVDPELYPDAR